MRVRPTALRRAAALRTVPARNMGGHAHATSMDPATKNLPNNFETYAKAPIGDSLWRGLVVGFGVYCIASYYAKQNSVGYSPANPPKAKPAAAAKAADDHAAPAAAAHH